MKKVIMIRGAQDAAKEQLRNALLDGLNTNYNRALGGVTLWNCPQQFMSVNDENTPLTLQGARAAMFDNVTGVMGSVGTPANDFTIFMDDDFITLEQMAPYFDSIIKHGYELQLIDLITEESTKARNGYCSNFKVMRYFASHRRAYLLTHGVDTLSVAVKAPETFMMTYAPEVKTMQEMALAELKEPISATVSRIQTPEDTARQSLHQVAQDAVEELNAPLTDPSLQYKEEVRVMQEAALGKTEQAPDGTLLPERP